MGECDHLIQTKLPLLMEKRILGVTIEALYKKCIYNDDFLTLYYDKLTYSHIKLNPWKSSDTGCCKSREMSYVVELGYLIGPKTSTVDQTQRVHFLDKTSFIVEKSSQSKDVPFGEEFKVEEKWIIKSNENSVDISLYGTTNWITSSWGSSMFKSKIDSKSIATVKDTFTIFVEMSTDYCEFHRDPIIEKKR